MTRALLCLVMLVLTPAAQAGKPQRPDATTQLPDSERTLKDISSFLKEVARANTIEIYEGLPHQAFERDLHQTELKRTDLIRFEGYPFYARPLPVTAAHKKALSEIVLRPDGHVPFGGYKACGGYHPDYAIIWTKDGRMSGSLICFGCHEWKNFTSAGRLYEDIGQETYDALRAILTPYAASRPRTKNKQP